MSAVSWAMSLALLPLLVAGTAAASESHLKPLAQHVRDASDRFKAAARLAWKASPHGAFADMNPAVTCEYAPAK
jgi:hypothetical protein